jgi:hydroxyacylglutathione hydrolase
MREVADGVWQLRGFPKNAINVYLANGVLFDAATRQGERRILRQLRGHAVTEHALTHAHADHQGAPHRVCTELGIPLAVGEADLPAMENGAPVHLVASALGADQSHAEALLNRAGAPG